MYTNLVSFSGHIRGELRFPGGAAHPSLSLSVYLSSYLSRTEQRRKYHLQAEGARPDRMFISNTKPYQSVQPSTLAKWVLVAMEGASIDTASYKAHSARSAGASDLIRKGFSVSQIMARAHWSQNSETFQRFYNRELS